MRLGHECKQVRAEFLVWHRRPHARYDHEFLHIVGVWHELIVRSRIERILIASVGFLTQIRCPPIRGARRAGEGTCAIIRGLKWQEGDQGCGLLLTTTDEVFSLFACR